VKTQYPFQKNSEYDKVLPPNVDIPMFIGVVDIDGKVFDGKIYRKVTKWGKEELILCLEIETTNAPF
jgi:hypothetical protein|tara:strand:+ start:2152 stop:2352 length:201 start_codon:yes stop_codon:yes gene_type:complete